MLPKVIGLTGPSSGGKDTIAELLKKKGYKVAILSDKIQEEGRKRGKKVPLGREELQDLGNELRRKHGDNVLALRVLSDDYKEGVPLVIDGLRNPAEIDVIRMFAKDVLIIGIRADIEKRAEWAMLRGREGEALTQEEFRRLDKREFSEKGSGAMQLQVCWDMADIKIENNGTLKDLEIELENALSRRNPEGAILGPERR
jgi:dephospho-CoA kinase